MSLEDPLQFNTTVVEDTVPLDEVLTTEQIRIRPVRNPDYRAENEALVGLASCMAKAPETFLQRLVETALALCQADGAGLSLIEQSGSQTVFKWKATAGMFATFAGTTLPRDFSPCGVVVDRDALQLMTRPERYYPYVRSLGRTVHEVLLAPFHFEGKPIGTLWVARQDPKTEFDGGDARRVTHLTTFASAAWQTLANKEETRAVQSALREEEVRQIQTRAELETSQQRERRTTALFRAFFEQFPFYAGILDREGVTVESGNAAFAVSGYSKQQVLGQLFWNTPWWRDVPEAREQIKSGFRRVVTGENYTAVLPYHFSDGLRRYVELSLTPVFEEGRRVAFVIATGNDISDRLQVENELALARKRLESALIAGEVGTYEFDVIQGRIYGDRNFARIFSLPVEKAGNLSVQDLLHAVHQDDRARVGQEIDRSISTGVDFNSDFRIQHLGERWANGRGRMVKDHSGRFVRFHGVAVDITERKAAEAARADVQRRFEQQSLFFDAVLASIDDLAQVMDLEGRFRFVNRPLLKLWGLQAEEARGKTFRDLDFPEALAVRLQQQMAEVVKTKKSLSDEAEYTPPGGKAGHYHYIFTPIFGKSGEVEFIAGLTREITERKRAEERGRLLVAIDDATRPLTNPLEITQTSARLLGDYLKVSRCAYAMVEPDEDTFHLIGDHNRGVTSIVGKYRISDFGRECARLMRIGVPYVVDDVETDPRAADVREAYAATAIRAVISVPLLKQGRFVAGMAVHSTSPRAWRSDEVELLQSVANRCWESIERTRVLRELAEAHRTLEQHAKILELRVAERTSTLQETISELEAFSYSISHDLRGPLRSMRSFAQALQEDCGASLDSVGTDYVRRIVSAAERMDQIIQDVLVLSRIARTDLVLEPVALGDFIASLLEGYPQFNDGSARIIVSGPMPVVMANKAALTQCFSNLIGNAIKFVAPGVFPTVELSAVATAEKVRVFIRDNGIGLERSFYEKIFGAFYRLHSSYPGTGIGLAIVRKAVERMGGQVGVESTLGQGSTFYLELQRAPT